MITAVLADQGTEGPQLGCTYIQLDATKTTRLESLDQIKARLGPARSVVDAARLALSPQCGFATSVVGNAITAEAQRAKVALLVRAARDLLGT